MLWAGCPRGPYPLALFEVVLSLLVSSIQLQYETNGRVSARTEGKYARR